MSSENLPYLFIMIIVFIGGVLNHIAKIKNNTIKKFDIWVLLFDMLLSIFIGLTVFALCKGFGVNEWVSAAFIALSVKRELGFFDILENIIFKLLKIKKD